MEKGLFLLRVLADTVHHGAEARLPEWEVSGHSVVVVRKQGLRRTWGQL